MAPIAAVMTGPGAGAVATIQLYGNSAEDVLRAVFRQPHGKPYESNPGRILLGDIVEGQQVIDQITVGCEGLDAFAIHCHGNPLIVEQIMGLLRRHGVQPVGPEQLLSGMRMNRECRDSLTTEAKLALTTVKTIEGASIIANQVKAGLAAKARQWRAELDATPLERIAAEAKQILHDSDTARLILSGCTIVLIGPPNSGKSTLLNTLAGREKAIVTDIPGTTRDWVSAELRLPPLAATLIDTAGLDPALATTGDIDEAAQQRSWETVNLADLTVLVLDASRPADQLSEVVAESLLDRKTITVLNKADLLPRLDPKSLPTHLQNVVHISAKQESGIDDLIRAIHETCGLTDLSLNTPVAFTDRQRTLLERLSVARSRGEALAIFNECLHGPIVQQRL